MRRALLLRDNVCANLTQVEIFSVDARREIAPSKGDFWRKMEVQNPEELMKVLLDNPSARSQLNSFVEQAIAKSHVS